MKRRILFWLVLVFVSQALPGQPKKQHHLVFESLAKRWDEAIPLGNGWLGALIWQKDNKLRLSLDRVDLWDDRPMPEIDKLKFSFVVKQVKNGDYDTVQKLGDEPYEKYAAPTKIPGAALEFNLAAIGIVVSNELDISNGLSTIKFRNGIVFNNYIHASRQVGYFGFEGISAVVPELITPGYNTGNAGTVGNSVEGLGLERLGYRKGSVSRTSNSIRYHQPTWGTNFYEVLVKWYKRPGNKLIGQWTISNNKTAVLPDPDFRLQEPTGWPSHINWWNAFWSRSAVSLPDPQLERQYYLEMYKFGCVARGDTPPISLQAIWTADNGNLPPWKGDFHHDLNTQLSYWPGYTANHLELTAGYTNWLWKVRRENERWTRSHFELPGVNVPGVTTISGKPMGGWIQYSMSPTTSAWLAQHFYWQAIYSMDKTFAERAKAYLYDVYTFNNEFLGKSRTDTGFIALSSSPEIHDNTIKAWFRETTNYDKALVLSLKPQYRVLQQLFPGGNHPALPQRDNVDGLGALDVNETGLTVAPNENLHASHRHHSPYMAIYPTGLLDIDKRSDSLVIENSLKHIEAKGTGLWCGYSFSWMACIYARARKPEKAVQQLKIFASNFCSVNSFHLNGDQKGGEHSTFTYRPFTLEGNFAFAQGVHELLLQTRNGVIEVFPAVPVAWKDVSFSTLRAERAFLVSARKVGGITDEVTVTAGQQGTLRLKIPFKTFYITNLQKKYRVENGTLEIPMDKKETVIIKNGYE